MSRRGGKCFLKVQRVILWIITTKTLSSAACTRDKAAFYCREQSNKINQKNKILFFLMRGALAVSTTRACQRDCANLKLFSLIVKMFLSYFLRL